MLDGQVDDVFNDVTLMKQPLYYEFKNCKATHEDSTSNKKKEWKPALEPTVINNCTIDDWYELFLSDDAPNSIKMYQTKIIGDTNVTVDEWRKAAPSSNVESESLERDLSYLHAISKGAAKMVGSQLRRKHSNIKRGNGTGITVP